MKKSIAVFLSFCMLLSTSTAVIAEGASGPPDSQDTSSGLPDGGNTNSGPENEEGSAESSPEDDTATPKKELEQKKLKQGTKGDLQVSLQLKLNKAEAVKNRVSAVLIGKDQQSFSLDMTVSSAQTLTYSAKEIPEGTYTLTMSGAGYQTYSQEITVQPYAMTSVTLSDSHETDTKDGTPCPGVFALGDVNQDGKVDKTDSDLMIRQIESNVPDKTFDLNMDNLVDLADLSLMAYNIGKEAVVAGQVIQVSKDAVMLADSPDTGTVQKGSMADLLEGTGTVGIAPAAAGPISNDNPVVFSMEVADNAPKTEAVTIVPPSNSDNSPSMGVILVEDSDGNQYEAVFGAKASPKSFFRSLFSTAATATIQPDGTIVINLNRQIAIKKVTITITGTTQGTSLAEISKVEFLNGMENRIPEPVMNVPTGLTALPADKEFTIKWDAQPNVTGYMVEISQGGKKEIRTAGTNHITVNQFGSDKLVNKTDYSVRVQSVNGDWSSGYSEPIIATPVASKAPDAPESINIAGNYKQLTISWKAMKDTDGYNLYYKKTTDQEYQSVLNITGTSYVLKELDNQTEYQIYMTGYNDIGTSPKSRIYTGKTVNVRPVVPNYKLVNTSNGIGELTSHIEKVEVDAKLESAYPNGFDPNWIVDDNYETHWTSRDNAQMRGATVTFDQAYEMDHAIVTTRLESGYGSVAHWSITVWDENGNQTVYNDPPTTGVSGAANTFRVTFPKQSVKKIKIAFSRYYADPVSLSEIHFYYYDSLEDDVDGLFTDDLHLSLNEAVTMEQIEGLETRANTVDDVSGEYHPKRNALLKELENARLLLNDSGLSGVMTVDQSITTANTGYLNFAFSLNSFQPLGIVAKEGETINVYVGQDGVANGQDVPVQLVFTQFHGESSAWLSNTFNLKQGKNEIVVPKISSVSTERGGSVYIKYPNGSKSKDIQVRVSGGSPIPVLNVGKITGEAERKAAIRDYLIALNNQVYTLQQQHDKQHTVEGYQYTYQDQSCILNSTEIALGYTLYSVPAKPILSGLGLTASEQLSDTQLNGAVDKMYGTLAAMDQMMNLFYSQKGLDAAATSGNNRMPTARVNIRYSTMFAGAFMYAGGQHVGIEYGSVGGLMGGSPIIADDKGKYQSGSQFGWGIAHEIGHVIDQGGLVYGETTNNIFSQFSMSHDTADTTRIPYEEVYEKVTSGTKMLTSNVFTNLGMFWQLHLAYDENYLYKKYPTYADQQQSQFYSRFYSYKRTPAEAPNDLKLSGDKDQDTIRLACAAAKKDLTNYFIRWGLTPNPETITYAGSFEKETRDLFYLNDGAHEYTLAGSPAMSKNNGIAASLEHANGKDAKKVVLQLGITDSASADAMLGYEIRRNGTPIAFVTADQSEYTDVISAMNNRVFTYSVVGYDKYLNKTKEVTLDPIKVSHDGSLDKSNWSITTNMTSKNDLPNSDFDQCTPVPESAITAIIDDQDSTSYTGTAASGSPYFILDLKDVQSITGFRYTAGENPAAVKNYEIYVSSTANMPANNGSWKLVKSGAFALDENHSQTVYFNQKDDNWMYTYDASYVMFVAKGSNQMSVQEFDLIGQPGDNVEFLPENGIGILKDDFNLGDAGSKIPAGSFIVTGEYRGNPSYNVVKLLDENNQLISGTQVIFAKVPEHGELGEISSGTWVYYIEPNDIKELPSKLRAELYRVNDALTNEGERFVSDTLMKNVPEVLPEITLSGSGN